MVFVNANQISYHWDAINVYHVSDWYHSNLAQYVVLSIISIPKQLAAKIDDFCLNDQQCILGDKYTYCKYIIPRIYGKCKCPLGYLTTEDNRCLPSNKSFYKLIFLC